MHVESVSSLVGRADCLSGLFFLLAMIVLIKAQILMKKNNLSKRNKFCNLFIIFILFTLSILFSFFSVLSKEVGIITFPSLILLIFIFDFKEFISNNYGDIENYFSSSYNKIFSDQKLIQKNEIMNKENEEIDDENDLEKYLDDIPLLSTNYYSILFSDSSSLSFSSSLSILKHIKILFSSLLYSLTKFSSLIQIIIIFTSIFLFFYFRIEINGKNKIFMWSILENHIITLPNLSERIFSLGQSHFFYFIKLFYPISSSFDYGYDCFPLIFSYKNILNLFPLIAYYTNFLILYKNLKFFNLHNLFFYFIYLISLLPALNIFFPVGTLLADRLMFLPSIGFILLIVSIFDQNYLILFEKNNKNFNENHYFLLNTKLFFLFLDNYVFKSLYLFFYFFLNYSNFKIKNNSFIQNLNEFYNSQKKYIYSPHTKVLSQPIVLSSLPEFSQTSNTSLFSSRSDSSKNNSKNSSISPPLIKSTNIFQITYSNSLKFFNSFLIFFLLLTIHWSKLTFYRNFDWKNEVNMYESSLKVCPRSLKGLSNSGMLLMNHVNINEINNYSSYKNELQSFKSTSISQVLTPILPFLSTFFNNFEDNDSFFINILNKNLYYKDFLNQFFTNYYEDYNFNHYEYYLDNHFNQFPSFISSIFYTNPHKSEINDENLIILYEKLINNDEDYEKSNFLNRFFSLNDLDNEIYDTNFNKYELKFIKDKTILEKLLLKNNQILYQKSNFISNSTEFLTEKTRDKITTALQMNNFYLSLYRYNKSLKIFPGYISSLLNKSILFQKVESFSTDDSISNYSEHDFKRVQKNSPSILKSINLFELLLKEIGGEISQLHSRGKLQNNNHYFYSISQLVNYLSSIQKYDLNKFSSSLSSRNYIELHQSDPFYLLKRKILLDEAIKHCEISILLDNVNNVKNYFYCSSLFIEYYFTLNKLDQLFNTIKNNNINDVGIENLYNDNNKLFTIPYNSEVPNSYFIQVTLDLLTHCITIIERNSNYLSGNGNDFNSIIEGNKNLSLHPYDIYVNIFRILNYIRESISNIDSKEFEINIEELNKVIERYFIRSKKLLNNEQITTLKNIFN